MEAAQLQKRTSNVHSIKDLQDLPGKTNDYNLESKNYRKLCTYRSHLYANNNSRAFIFFLKTKKGGGGGAKFAKKKRSNIRCCPVF